MFSEISEFSKSISWYTGRKLLIFGQVFETGKGIVVEVLKARRGTYQKPFLHVGLVFLIAAAGLSAPLIINSYPSSATSNEVLSATPPSAVLNPTTDINNLDTTTRESEKPRRDVIEYTVKSGDTLSTIAKNFGVDSKSIAILNDISVNKLLRPDDVIKIPPVSGIIVKVKSGDTIQSLAKKYGLPSAQSIVDWPYNNFVNDETFALAAGQTLVIPGGQPPQEAPIIPRAIQSPTIFAGGTGQFSWPTGGTITQYFAWYHSGLDIANNTGTSVAAADSGRVISVQYLSYGYGYHVIIDHGNGYNTLYGHLSQINVGVGDNINRGQRIGLMGSTGRSTGPHLHFEVRRSNATTNPLDYLH